MHFASHQSSARRAGPLSAFEPRRPAGRPGSAARSKTNMRIAFLLPGASAGPRPPLRSRLRPACRHACGAARSSYSRMSSSRCSRRLRQRRSGRQPIPVCACRFRSVDGLDVAVVLRPEPTPCCRRVSRRDTGRSATAHQCRRPASSGRSGGGLQREVQPLLPVLLPVADVLDPSEQARRKPRTYLRGGDQCVEFAVIQVYECGHDRRTVALHRGVVRRQTSPGRSY